jgi:hypothetical protein
MRPVYKFESMFRGQQVIIEYGLCNSDKEIDYAIISEDTPNFVHPNYKIFNDFLDKFHRDVWNITKKHLCKVTDASDVFL